MNRMKKLLSLILMMCLSLALLSGCGGEKTGTTEKAEPADVSDNTTAEPGDGTDHTTAEPDMFKMTAVLYKYLMGNGEGDHSKIYMAEKNGEPMVMKMLSEEDQKVLENLKSGDLIEITYNGVIEESYPAQISPYHVESSGSEGGRLNTEVLQSLSALGYTRLLDAPEDISLLLMNSISEQFGTPVIWKYGEDGQSVTGLFILEKDGKQIGIPWVRYFLTDTELDYSGDIGSSAVFIREAGNKFLYMEFDRYAYAYIAGIRDFPAYSIEEGSEGPVTVTLSDEELLSLVNTQTGNKEGIDYNALRERYTNVREQDNAEEITAVNHELFYADDYLYLLADNLWILPESGKTDRILEILSGSDIGNSALSLFSFDGEKTTLIHIYDQGLINNIFHQLTEGDSYKTGKDKIRNMKAPYYGLKIGGKDRKEIWLSFAQGLWLDKENNVYRSQIDFEKVWQFAREKVETEEVTPGGFTFPNAVALGVWDNSFYIKPEGTDVLWTTDGYKDIYPTEGVSMTVTGFSEGTQVHCTLNNETDKPFTYGSMFSLQKKIDGKWNILPIAITNFAWTSEARDCPAETSQELTFNIGPWKELEDGTMSLTEGSTEYRIVLNGIPAAFFAR